MANIPNIHYPPPQSLEEHEQFPPPQTLDHSNTTSSSFLEDDDDDLVNIHDSDVPYTFVLDPFSPFDQVNSNSCSSCLSGSESESDCADSTVYPDCLYGRDDEYDQMDFVTDLFDSRGESERVSGCLSSNDVGISEINDHDDDFVQNNIHDVGLWLGLEGSGGGGGGGLRVTRIESDSDTEDLSARVDERDGLSSVIERIEEISVSSDISSEGEAAVGVLEWEILLAVNNFERDLEFATEGGEEGFVYTPEFNTLIGQFVETVRALRGSPPAAKSFVDNLPLVALKREDDTVICAVCKDEILVEEKVTQLPCKHHYHVECIVPWLSIRNTCPVCRFELPTDDVDYERSKNRAEDDDGELRVGYGFDLSP